MNGDLKLWKEKIFTTSSTSLQEVMTTEQQIFSLHSMMNPSAPFFLHGEATVQFASSTGLTGNYSRQNRNGSSVSVMSRLRIHMYTSISALKRFMHRWLSIL